MTKWLVMGSKDGRTKVIDILPDWDLRKRRHLVDRYDFLDQDKITISPVYKKDTPCK